MTELEILRRRRELVLLSAELQRATLTRRLDRLHDPARVAVAVATSAVSIPLLWKLGSSAYHLATRVYRRRSLKERLFSTIHR